MVTTRWIGADRRAMRRDRYSGGRCACEGVHVGGCEDVRCACVRVGGCEEVQ